MKAEIWDEITENGGKLEKALKAITRAYDCLCDAIDNDDDTEAEIWGDMYENRIEYYAKKLGVSYNWLEDSATDYRLYGWDCC